jgi:enoyl-[acyl-carrier protein] reductase I
MGLLDGKTGLVVGIANDRSYAFHIAKALTEHGATCAFTHLPGDKNERRTRKAVESMGQTDAWMRPLDASSDEEMDKVFADYDKSFDRMDFLVHSIAFADREWLQPRASSPGPRAQAYLGGGRHLRVHPRRDGQPGPGADGMGKDGAGRLASCACPTTAADKVVPGYNVMGVAKAALECTARYLAAELGESGIRVNSISGGYLRTLASSAVAGTDQFSDHAETRSPLRRNVEGADVGGTAVWLASDLSSGVTGETIYVDCGVNIIGL